MKKWINVEEIKNKGRTAEWEIVGFLSTSEIGVMPTRLVGMESL